MTIVIPSLSEATIRSHSSPESYSRGRGYYDRGAVAEHGGREVDCRADELFAVFDDLQDALAAASAAQSALAAWARPPSASFRVRMGIHAGAPILAEGTYVGVDVNLTARVCSAGYGGQVLVSRAARELNMDGFEFRVQQLQDPAPDRVAEDVERVHPESISAMTYMNKWPHGFPVTTGSAGEPSVRTVIRREHDALFERYDVLCSATSPTVAFRLGEKTANPLGASRTSAPARQRTIQLPLRWRKRLKGEKCAI